MKAPRKTSYALPPTSQLATLAEWLDFAERVYEEAGLVLGQVAVDAHDEALYLFLRTLDWPLDSDPSVLGRKLTPDQRISLRNALGKRAVDRIPVGYLTKEAFLGDHRFYVDERVIIPRSYFLEIIPGQLDELLGRAPDTVDHVVDVCTGSGCLAILLAHHFSRARVDAIDLSDKALEVARINVRAHGLTKRVDLHQSDVFDAVKPVKYDIILSNPPYEPSDLCDSLPPEFKKEPRLALDGGKDGLVIIRKLLDQAKTRLKPDGLLLIEVGELQGAMARAWPRLRIRWLDTEDGSNCVCVIQARDLLA
ncbi:MAG: 50S ribosomal protein L3 N(5)-glutamine methyltransferase [Opitutaceae bacterium]|nr:50S ribosomal protein L3 N(5)-glutamine methyltransferase [Opitutaceae bacterium]